jgi:hypothetical protein
VRISADHVCGLGFETSFRTLEDYHELVTMRSEIMRLDVLQDEKISKQIRGLSLCSFGVVSFGVVAARAAFLEIARSDACSHSGSLVSFGPDAFGGRLFRFQSKIGAPLAPKRGQPISLARVGGGAALAGGRAHSGSPSGGGAVTCGGRRFACTPGRGPGRAT